MDTRVVWLLVTLSVGSAVSAQGQALNVVGIGQAAAEFTGTDTTGGYYGGGEVLHVEVKHTNAAQTIAVYGEARPQAGYGYGGYFDGGFVGALGIAPTLGSSLNRGVWGQAIGADDNRGVQGYAVAADDEPFLAYGVYGSADCADNGGACTKYAVYASGDLAYTGSLVNASDLRFKQSLAPMGPAVAKLLELEVVYYEFIESEELSHMNLPRGPRVGFIAQQVAQVLPELVIEAAHPGAGPRQGFREGDAPIRYQGLKTLDLVPYLVRAIQEQQAEIEALKARLDR